MGGMGGKSGKGLVSVRTLTTSIERVAVERSNGQAVKLNDFPLRKFHGPIRMPWTSPGWKMGFDRKSNLKNETVAAIALLPYRGIPVASTRGPVW